MQKGLKELQLLLDMKVRWGSTYVMLNRAESQKDVSCTIPLRVLYLCFLAVNTFVYEIGQQEDDLSK